MRAPLTEIQESKAPHSESYETPCEVAGGRSFSGDAPRLNPSRPVDGGSTHDGGEESPMWRTVLRA
jgi:hypothetical protein